MTRPPLISKDMLAAPFVRNPGTWSAPCGTNQARVYADLLPARSYGDLDRLVVVAVHVDVRLLQLVERDVGPVVVGRARRQLLDHAVGLGDVGRACDRRLGRVADAGRVRPDQLVDLVHLP